MTSSLKSDNKYRCIPITILLGKQLKLYLYATALHLFINLKHKVHIPHFNGFWLCSGYIYVVYIYSIKLTKNPQSGQKCGCTFSWIFKPKTQVWSPLITHSMGATWMIRVPERGWTSTRMQTYVYMRNWRLAMRIALKWTISEHFLLLFALYLLRFAHRYIFISNIFILYYWFFIYISNTHQLYCVCE